MSGTSINHDAFEFDHLLAAAHASEKLRRQSEPPLKTLRELQDEMLKVLIFSLAYQSESFRGQTAEELESIKQRAIHRFNNDPQFRAFIHMQCKELLRVVERYQPE